MTPSSGRPRQPGSPARRDGSAILRGPDCLSRGSRDVKIPFEIADPSPTSTRSSPTSARLTGRWPIPCRYPPAIWTDALAIRPRPLGASHVLGSEPASHRREPEEEEAEIAGLSPRDRRDRRVRHARRCQGLGLGLSSGATLARATREPGDGRRRAGRTGGLRPGDRDPRKRVEHEGLQPGRGPDRHGRRQLHQGPGEWKFRQSRWLSARRRGGLGPGPQFRRFFRRIGLEVGRIGLEVDIEGRDLLQEGFEWWGWGWGCWRWRR